MTPDTAPLTAPGIRNATLDGLTALLRDQDVRKYDILAPAWAIHARGGQLVIEASEPVIGPEGISLTSGTYRPTGSCNYGLARQLGMPAASLEKLRTQRLSHYDSSINSWLNGNPRRFLVRCLRSTRDNVPGVARAFLPEGDGHPDNLDVLHAALNGIYRAGMPVQIDGCDLTDQKMYIRITGDRVQAKAPALLKDHRPAARSGAGDVSVSAGLLVSSSETGFGTFTLTPRLVIQDTLAGIALARDAINPIQQAAQPGQHAGNRSGASPDEALQMVAEKTREAVSTFLDRSYLDQAITMIDARASHPLPDPHQAIQALSQHLPLAAAHQASITRHLLDSGDNTAGGVMLAVSAIARGLADADVACELEAEALRALEIAACL